MKNDSLTNHSSFILRARLIPKLVIVQYTYLNLAVGVDECLPANWDLRISEIHKKIPPRVTFTCSIDAVVFPWSSNRLYNGPGVCYDGFWTLTRRVVAYRCSSIWDICTAPLCIRIPAPNLDGLTPAFECIINGRAVIKVRPPITTNGDSGKCYGATVVKWSLVSLPTAVNRVLSPLVGRKVYRDTWGRGGVVDRLIASHLGELGSIQGGAAPGPSHLVIVPRDAAGRRVFSGISRHPPPPHSGAAPYSPHFTLIGSQGTDVTSRPNLSTLLGIHHECIPPRRTGFNPWPCNSRIFACVNRSGRYRWSAGFLGDLPFRPPFHSSAAPFSLQSPSSALKTSLLGAAKSLHSLTRHDCDREYI
ncbi:hypothetical protein PR048_024017 [Dryococelus australis]|uniref:Uncharacterized protein n=1 Tax=Dryococelus australis TaxID=614101 RepID=A0ABQ9GVR0_9NEOP|nr:hypothetical protein PR048_024017 [Dryococelus australis]